MAEPLKISRDDVWRLIQVGDLIDEDHRFLVDLRTRDGDAKGQIDATVKEAARFIRIRNSKERPKANGHTSGDSQPLEASKIDADAEAPVSLDDFYAYMPAHNYLFVPTRSPWPAASVNARILPSN